MNTAEHEWPRLAAVEVDDRCITATVHDGRRVSVPLWWSWRLEAATAEQVLNSLRDLGLVRTVARFEELLERGIESG